MQGVLTISHERLRTMLKVLDVMLIACYLYVNSVVEFLRPCFDLLDERESDRSHRTVECHAVSYVELLMDLIEFGFDRG